MKHPTQTLNCFFCEKSTNVIIKHWQSKHQWPIKNHFDCQLCRCLL